MKTPEEIKQSLEQCSHNKCANCVYFRDGCANRLMRDTLEYINELEAKAPMWISVDDILPEKDTEVMVYDNGGLFGLAYYDSKGTWHSCNTCYRITHWMPLPESQKEV